MRTKKLEISYIIPTTKKDIKLKDWMKFEKIVREQDIEPDFVQMKMLEIFCELSNEYSKKLKQEQIDEILHHLNNVLGTKSELTQTFTFNGKKYGLIPDFDSDITAGELIDLDNYLVSKDYDRLLSILYREITFESNGLYQIAPYISTHTDFQELQYDILDGVLSFFFGYVRKTRRSFPEIYPESSEEIEESRHGLSREAQFVAKWGGYTEIIWLLSNGDVTKVEKIYKMKAHEFLYWAAYLIEKRKIEVERYQKN